MELDAVVEPAGGVGLCEGPGLGAVTAFRVTSPLAVVGIAVAATTSTAISPRRPRTPRRRDHEVRSPPSVTVAPEGEPSGRAPGHQSG